MEVFATPDTMRAWSDDQRAASCRIGVVPTMGALHGGHIELIAQAAERADRVIVTIFVNPLQFNQPSDFDTYPRPIDSDLEVCRQEGVDAVYAPTGAAMYPPEFGTGVAVVGLTEPMEGAMRPGHFDGVTTVVTKLLNAVRPDIAVFGEKDYQQLAIVRRMAADLDFGVEVVGHPIVREPDGVALSSRNSRLGADERTAARCVSRALAAASAEAAVRDTTVAQVVAAAREVIAAEPLARPEYVTVFDRDTLVELDVMAPSARIAAAVWFGDVRLIDNRALLDD